MARAKAGANYQKYLSLTKEDLQHPDLKFDQNNKPKLYAGEAFCLSPQQRMNSRGYDDSRSLGRDAARKGHRSSAIQYYGLINPDNQGICEAYTVPLDYIFYSPEFRDDTEKAVEVQRQKLLKLIREHLGHIFVKNLPSGFRSTSEKRVALFDSPHAFALEIEGLFKTYVPAWYKEIIEGYEAREDAKPVVQPELPTRLVKGETRVLAGEMKAMVREMGHTIPCDSCKTDKVSKTLLRHSE